MICAPINGAITQTPDGSRFSVHVEDLRVIVEARGEIGSFLTKNTDIFPDGQDVFISGTLNEASTPMVVQASNALPRTRGGISDIRVKNALMKCPGFCFV
ncbi:Uncharacterised protein [Arcanobacterium haemolyticum]|uniref:Uncharacterized protein n=1 Tax=Arcanobacterium haemolyticum (strain ATCC 9345 / DSM 20595 / CCM 5947 / CCUG 17215 / LMG 16163 / NBRC 15585 / NCTC 8452 / 11018) TaxID=644284 RepID=D7BLB6_ARCHD|nr:hypothetical protein Arch_1764 [Arcanobacterium haemolyticum DSM 20595]SQH27575.1 Uncharacterised protein [Arcanobacterium haemolyticum]